jgi:cell division protein FtsZ
MQPWKAQEEIRELLADNTKMVFITAGMGGGTGTGAAPVVAKIAKDLNILTVGIVTAPFMFEGKRKWQLRRQGIESLRENCDTVLVILNDKLREIYGNLAIRTAFSKGR